MKILDLTLNTNNIEAQKQFHRSVFDHKFVNESNTHFTMQVGWTKLTFRQSAESHLYHYCYLIPSNKLASAIKWLDGKVDLIETNGSVIHDHDHWNAKAIYFYDGDGNIGEFIVRYDLDNAVDDEFSYNDILCINELGAPSRNPRKLNMFLQEKLGTTIWKGDLNRFAVNGDQEGMFLLLNNEVKDKWYPTNLFPQSSPFEVQIINSEQIFNLSFDGNVFKHLIL